MIFGHIHLKKELLTELELENKQQQIWNLDESSLSIDPSKSKNFGVIRISERDNTTIVLAANAAGGRIPLLIIFNAKKI